MAREVVLGRIVGVHGLDGGLKIESYTAPRDNIFRYRPWRIVGAGREMAVSQPQGRAQGRGLVARIHEVGDRDAAAAWVGAEIRVDRAQLPAPAPGSYYWTDLEGLRVRNIDGHELGRVSHLFATGSNDVLVVRGERERLIPFVEGSAVLRVDLEGGVIEVDWDPAF